MYDIDSIFPVLVNDREQVNAGSNTLTNAVDTLGFAGGLLIMTVHLDNVNALTTSAFNVQESDDNSSFSVVSGCDAVNDTQADGTAAPTFDASSDNTMIVFYIPLAGARKRYYRINFTNGASGNCGISCTGLIIGKRNASGPAQSAVDGPDGSIFRASNV
jgi:hypothetical protein